jgi:uncharacterized protein with beta-barrel porin domain
MSEGAASAYAAINKAVLKAPSPAPVWSIWGAGFAGTNKTNGDLTVIGSRDLTSSAYGFAIGADYRAIPDSVVGFAMSGGGTNWGLAQGLGGGRSDALQVGVYGSKSWGEFYTAGSASFANYWLTTDRNLIFAPDHLTASFDAQSYGGRLEGGYHFATMPGVVTPYVAVQEQSFHLPSCSEVDMTGDGFGLSFNSRTATDTRAEVGARFESSTMLIPAMTFRGRLAWAHDWVSDPTVAAVFRALPGAAFIVNGATPAKDSLLTSAGAEYHISQSVAVIGKFDGEFANNSKTYAGTGTVRVSW